MARIKDSDLKKMIKDAELMSKISDEMLFHFLGLSESKMESPILGYVRLRKNLEPMGSGSSFSENGRKAYDRYAKRLYDKICNT